MKQKLIFPFILQNLLWIPGMFLLIVFGRLSIKGRNNLRGLKGPLIFTSNHTSELDGILILSTLGLFSKYIPLVFVSREPTFYTPTLFKRILFLGNGGVFRALGAFPAIAGLRDYEKSLESHINFLKNSHRICIFPEGKIVHGGVMSNAKGGIGYLIHATNATVVPFKIDGAMELNWFSFFMMRHHISIKILPPVPASEFMLSSNTIGPEQCKETAKKILMMLYNA